VRFIETKRALGRRFANEERQLRLLDRFLFEAGARTIYDITARQFEDFLLSRQRRCARSYNHLLGVVRRLLEWLEVQGVPGVPKYRGHPRRETGRRLPVLFTDDQARRLLEAAAGLPDDRHALARARLRGPTYRMTFALLYGLGLRIGEVSRLELADLDLRERVLAIRRTKFGKDRFVPFGPRLAAAIEKYLEVKQKVWPLPSQKSPLLSLDGRQPISTNSIRRVFQQLVATTGVGCSASGSQPRVHDLRHGFAIATLLRWYRDGINPAERLHHLSTFLGHGNPAATAVYLTITWELLQEAERRFSKVAATVLPGVA
jgi:integrase